MTHWAVSHGDILDSTADGLICSANPNLNLSGGVGGAFALRYGYEMQSFLHACLRDEGTRLLQPGRSILAPAPNSPFAAVAHAVCLDVFYHTDAKTILSAYDDAITQLSDYGCATIAAACLGCGYGRVSDSQFSAVASELFTRRYDGVTLITLTTTNAGLVNTIRTVLADANR